MFLGTEEAAGPPHALALRHVQAAVGAGHHLLDLAALAVFLCRREAHNITGTALPVDGGWTAQ